MEANQKGISLDWIYMFPPAFQASVGTLHYFVLPGVLGLLVNKWAEITSRIWRRIMSVFSIDVTGLEPLFSGVSISIILLTFLVSHRLRNKKKLDPDKEPFQWSGHLNAFIVSVTISIFLSLFYLSNFLYLANVSSENKTSLVGLITIKGFLLFFFLLIFFVSFVIYCCIYYRYRYGNYSLANYVLSIEREYFKHLFAIPGAVLISSIVTMILYFILISSFTEFVMIFGIGNLTQAYFYLILIFSVGLMCSSFFWNFPKVDTLAKATEQLFGFMFVVFAATVIVAPFLPTYNSLDQSSKDLGSVILLISIVSLYTSIYITLNTNWKFFRGIIYLSFCFIFFAALFQGIEKYLS